MEIISSPYPWFGLFLCGFFYGIWKRDRKLIIGLVFCGIAMAAADVISFEIVKPFFTRERPCWVLQNVKIFENHCGGSYGLTSNHAANAAAAGMGLILFVPIVPRFLILAAVFLIGYSRVYLGVHYPGDVFAGYLLGVVVTTIFYALLKLKKRANF